eukprot:CAMPEP_0197704090 /NCGR_PEP_ID=MMETSP1338-20131121/125764_1 /TAXON_ID=43686 ORGANISM="Pelagodinium beii, Strain RCC1491" /NCGR_SAMPLE_ID=MMETSP1338 /ASSEMBLY_ACC=CAM_ASM_000754 /LENGTH=1097 /DNA_ID=CAMNT_0043287989 /DNA_START=66 /DNA_END=3359 /DNA_ORIENTATION=-
MGGLCCKKRSVQPTEPEPIEEPKEEPPEPAKVQRPGWEWWDQDLKSYTDFVATTDGGGVKGWLESADPDGCKSLEEGSFSLESLKELPLPAMSQQAPPPKQQWTWWEAPPDHFAVWHAREEVKEEPSPSPPLPPPAEAPPPVVEPAPVVAAPAEEEKAALPVEVDAQWRWWQLDHPTLKLHSEWEKLKEDPKVVSRRLWSPRLNDDCRLEEILQQRHLKAEEEKPSETEMQKKTEEPVEEPKEHVNEPVTEKVEQKAAEKDSLDAEHLRMRLQEDLSEDALLSLLSRLRDASEAEFLAAQSNSFSDGMPLVELPLLRPPAPRCELLPPRLGSLPPQLGSLPPELGSVPREVVSFSEAMEVSRSAEREESKLQSGADEETPLMLAPSLGGAGRLPQKRGGGAGPCREASAAADKKLPACGKLPAAELAAGVSKEPEPAEEQATLKVVEEQSVGKELELTGTSALATTLGAEHELGTSLSLQACLSDLSCTISGLGVAFPTPAEPAQAAATAKTAQPPNPPPAPLQQPPVALPGVSAVSKAPGMPSAEPGPPKAPLAPKAPVPKPQAPPAPKPPSKAVKEVQASSSVEAKEVQTMPEEPVRPKEPPKPKEEPPKPKEEPPKPKEEPPKPKEGPPKPKEEEPPKLKEEMDLGAQKKWLQEKLRGMSVLIAGLGAESEEQEPEQEIPCHNSNSESSPPRLPQLGAAEPPSRPPSRLPPPLRLAAATASSEATLKVPMPAQACEEHLHLTVGDVDGIPDQAMLSFKLAGVRRQAPLYMLRGQGGGARASTLRLPVPNILNQGQALMLGVTVLQPLVESSVVLHPHFGRYNLDLGLGPLGPLRLEFRVSGHGSYGQSMEEEKVMEAAGCEAAAMVKGFLNQHKLLQYVPALLQAVIREKPVDPYRFMAQQLHYLSTQELATSAPAGAHLELLRAEGLPEGSLLSVRCGGDRRQASISALLKEGLRLKLSKGLLMQAQVLVPIAPTIKLPVTPDKEVYRMRLKHQDASASHLTLRVQRGLPAGWHEIQGSVCASSEVPLSVGPDHNDQEEYLHQHRILDFARQLMKELAECRPAEPFAFIATRLLAMPPTGADKLHAGDAAYGV